ncbi:MAG: hypothetical protein JWQ10_1480 [Herbaspirillum sp.]|nr:hypothetical protein [Herbaspirillum sp.]
MNSSMNTSMNTSTALREASSRQLMLSVDGQRVDAHVSGAGAPIVLFHSLLADGTSFDRIAGPLSLTHQVIVLNLPGFGNSDRVDGGMEAVAERLAAAVRLMALEQAPIFLGNGYGGFLALMVAIRHPGIARRLVLADCGAAFSEPGRAAFLGMAATVSAHGLDRIADVAMRRLFSPAYQSQNPELITERRQRFVDMDTQTFQQACNALASLDLRSDLAAVQAPVLVLVGEQDEATPPAMSEELAAGLPHARLQILPGCAHVPQLQEPHMFLSAIKEFINE